MWSSYDETIFRHAYKVSIDSTNREFFYAYPAIIDLTKCCVSYNGRIHRDYANPPSDILKSLIQHSAPMAVIIDKLLEEYPQWEQPIMLAYGEHVRQQSSADPLL